MLMDVQTIRVLPCRRRRIARAGCLSGFLLAGLASAFAGAATVLVDMNPSPDLGSPQARYAALLACPTTLDHIGRVVVPVMIDGRGPFRFVVDTGASHSSVSTGLVQKLGLKVSEAPIVELEGITGSAPVPGVMIDRLRVGSLTLRRTAMPALWSPVMAGADGILGVAGLTDQSLLVDFEHNRVEIAGALNPEVRFEYSRVPAERVAGGLMAVVAYVGNVRTTAIIDTGSERSLGNPALRDALNLRSDPGKLERVTSVYGATPQVEAGRIVAAPVIGIGPLRVSGADLIYGDFHIFKLWGLAKQPAMIIGMDVLGTVNGLGLDFYRHELFVSSARNKGDPFSNIHAYGSGNQIH